MTRKKILCSLVVLLLGLANVIAYEKDSPLAFATGTVCPPEMVGFCGPQTSATLGKKLVVAQATDGPRCDVPALSEPTLLQQAVYTEAVVAEVDLAQPLGIVGKVGEIVGGLLAGLFAQETTISGMTLPSGQYLEQPPQFIPPPPSLMPTSCGSQCLPPPVLPPLPTRTPWTHPAMAPAMLPHPVPCHVPCALPCPVPCMPMVPQMMPCASIPQQTVTPAKSVSITLDDSGSKPMLKVQAGDGSTIHCKTMILTPAEGASVKVAVSKDRPWRMTVKGTNFTGDAQKVTTKGDTIAVEVWLSHQTGVISNPQLSQN